MRWFTADLHLGHQAIIRYCDRPYRSASEMDADILEAINDRVRKRDTLYVVGDFVWGDPAPYMKRIVCKDVRLVWGNHDKRRACELTKGLRILGDLAEVKACGRRTVLCHYAMRRWPRSHKGAWHLYGHSHGKLADDPEALAFDVGWDVWSRPLNEEDVRETMRKKPCGERL